MDPDFNTEELEALLRDLPTLDDANQAAVMIMAEAEEVSNMLYFGQTLIYYLLYNMNTCYIVYNIYTI